MSSPSPEGDIPPQSFSIFLTVYSKIRKTSARGKTTSKEEKSTKMKELLFAADNSNYLDFLQAILLKHGLESYEVTEKKHFPLKYVPPKAKGQQASDVIDVDNTADYREMCSEDDSEFTSNSTKLEKAYKNEQDKGLTYIGALGSIPLMLAMVHDWCLALEDGQVTITTPPNIESFNIANKAPILHLMCKAAVQVAQPASPAAVDLNSLTLAILLWTLAQFDSGLHPLTLPASPMPQTPAWN
ncbi:hypothetical protein EDC04DRAFT_2598014 [Pisolithus marmoratus]|nr:hypothetical protein EDC04DRAFT_2598014 [Pisolithus marmoratus]